MVKLRLKRQRKNLGQVDSVPLRSRRASIPAIGRPASHGRLRHALTEQSSTAGAASESPKLVKVGPYTLLDGRPPPTPPSAYARSSVRAHPRIQIGAGLQETRPEPQKRQRSRALNVLAQKKPNLRCYGYRKGSVIDVCFPELVRFEFDRAEQALKTHKTKESG